MSQYTPTKLHPQASLFKAAKKSEHKRKKKKDNAGKNGNKPMNDVNGTAEGEDVDMPVVEEQKAVVHKPMNNGNGPAEDEGMDASVAEEQKAVVHTNHHPQDPQLRFKAMFQGLLDADDTSSSSASTVSEEAPQPKITVTNYARGTSATVRASRIVVLKCNSTVLEGLRKSDVHKLKPQGACPKFASGNPATDRTAADLDKLFKPPTQRQLGRDNVSLSYRVGDLPPKGLGELLVKDMVPQERKYQDGKEKKKDRLAEGEEVC